MKNWRVVVIAAAVAALAGMGVAFAETAQDPAAQSQVQDGQMKGPKKKSRQTPEERLKRMGKQLQLTDQQKEQIKPILLEESEQIKAMKGDKTLNRQQKIDKMREIRDANHEKIRALLNPDQQQKLDQMREKAMARKQKKQEAAPAAPAAPKQ